MIEVIREVSKAELVEHLYDLDIRDSKLYDEINTDNYIGIFQFNGNTAKEMTSLIHPDNFEEMVSVNSLARPGTSSFAAQYVHNKKNPGSSTYPKQVNDLLKDSYNTILYQEQVMFIFNKIGGFTLEETNFVRGLMKKLGKADKKEADVKKWDETVKRFADGAITAGISKAEAARLADELLQLSAYSFNRSHAVAYTYNALMTLYLSAYFRRFYYSSVLTYEVEKKKDLLGALQAVKSHGFEILPPDVNRSKPHFSPCGDNAIIYGLQDIKFVGEEPAKIISKNAPYTSIFNFILMALKNGINKRVITALAFAGCFDQLDNNRKRVLYILIQFYERKKSVKNEEKLILLYRKIEEEASGMEFYTSYNDLVEYEKSFLDFNFFYSIFDPDVKKIIFELHKKGLIEISLKDVTSSVKVPVTVKQKRTFNDKNGKAMAFIEVEDMLGESISVPIFASYYSDVGEDIVPGFIYLMNFYKDEESKIMFGTDRWLKNSAQRKRLVKKIER